MAAYRRVYDSHHPQADCQEPGSAREPYAWQSIMGYLYLWPARRPGTRYQTTCEIRHVPFSVFCQDLKTLLSRFTSVHSALEALRLCTV